jgi:hypothetical protein
VIIAIIGILAGILLPALARARGCPLQALWLAGGQGRKSTRLP